MAQNATSEPSPEAELLESVTRVCIPDAIAATQGRCGLDVRTGRVTRVCVPDAIAAAPLDLSAVT